MDALARALLSAADILERGDIAKFKADRYAGWENSDLGKMMLSEGASLESIADHAAKAGLSPSHASGRQEMLENLVNRSLK